MREEGLDAEDAGIQQILKVVEVRRGHTAVEAAVYMQLSLRGVELDAQRFGCGGHGACVQWHLDQRGDASGGSGLRRGLETFPRRTPWLVDMHMRINDTGHDHLVAETLEVNASAFHTTGQDFLDLAIGEGERGFHHTLRSYHPCAMKCLHHLLIHDF